MENEKFILRVAVSGATRDELADSLLVVAEEIRQGGMTTDLSQDNCSADSTRADGTPFSFDYEVFPFPKDGVVTIRTGSEDE